MIYCVTTTTTTFFLIVAGTMAALRCLYQRQGGADGGARVYESRRISQESCTL
jgi:hypothetical protein